MTIRPQDALNTKKVISYLDLALSKARDAETSTKKVVAVNDTEETMEELELEDATESSQNAPGGLREEEVDTSHGRRSDDDYDPSEELLDDDTEVGSADTSTGRQQVEGWEGNIEITPESQKSFSDTFDDTMQKKILQTLIHDREWAQEVVDSISPNIFDKEYLRIVAKNYWGFFRKYRSFPSFAIFRSNLNSHIKTLDPVTRERVIGYMNTHASKPLEGDEAFVKNNVGRFCRRQAFREAIVESVEFLKAEKYDQIYSVMRKAMAGAAQGTKGHNFHTERHARWEGLERNPIPTGMDFIDEAINGGVSAGELAVVLAATGVGKSHFLVNVGANAVMNGFNVVHYTFELDEFTTGRRFDSNICDIPSNDVIPRRDEVEKIYEGLKKEAEENGTPMGDLYIKEYPTGTASVLTLRSNLERLAVEGFRPDLIVIDYADIMKSAGNAEGERFKQKAVYEELRALSKELKVPIWTASQSNREGAASDVITTEQMGESYGKAQVADLVLSISQKALEKEEGRARIFIAKNRLGFGGSVFGIEIDTARSKFRHTGEKLAFTESQGQDQQARRNYGADLARSIASRTTRSLTDTPFEVD